MDVARTRAEVDLYGWSPWGQRTLLGELEGEIFKTYVTS